MPILISINIQHNLWVNDISRKHHTNHERNIVSSEKKNRIYRLNKHAIRQWACSLSFEFRNVDKNESTNVQPCINPHYYLSIQVTRFRLQPIFGTIQGWPEFLNEESLVSRKLEEASLNWKRSPHTTSRRGWTNYVMPLASTCVGCVF